MIFYVWRRSSKSFSCLLCWVSAAKCLKRAFTYFFTFELANVWLWFSKVLICRIVKFNPFDFSFLYYRVLGVGSMTLWILKLEFWFVWVCICVLLFIPPLCYLLSCWNSGVFADLCLLRCFWKALYPDKFYGLLSFLLSSILQILQNQ